VIVRRPVVESAYLQAALQAHLQGPPRHLVEVCPVLVRTAIGVGRELRVVALSLLDNPLVRFECVLGPADVGRAVALGADGLYVAC
jgi:hypothetical protein